MELFSIVLSKISWFKSVTPKELDSGDKLFEKNHWNVEVSDHLSHIRGLYPWPKTNAPISIGSQFLLFKTNKICSHLFWGNTKWDSWKLTKRWISLFRWILLPFLAKLLSRNGCCWLRCCFGNQWQWSGLYYSFTIESIEIQN